MDMKQRRNTYNRLVVIFAERLEKGETPMEIIEKFGDSVKSAHLPIRQILKEAYKLVADLRDVEEITQNYEVVFINGKRRVVPKKARLTEIRNKNDVYRNTTDDYRNSGENND